MFGRYRTTMNTGNATGWSVTVFCEPRRRMMRMFVTCILSNFAADLSGLEWVYSLNRVTILCTNVGKIDCLGKNWLLGEKYFSWGKFAEGKTPMIGVTVLVKKKTCPHFTFCTPNFTCQGVQKPLVKNFSGHNEILFSLILNCVCSEKHTLHSNFYGLC